MIKGINKQIIEIKCPNSECFDKVLLFVKAEKSEYPSKFLQSQAKEYSQAITMQYKPKNNKKALRRFLLISILIIFGVTAGVILASLLI